MEDQLDEYIKNLLNQDDSDEEVTNVVQQSVTQNVHPENSTTVCSFNQSSDSLLSKESEPNSTGIEVKLETYTGEDEDDDLYSNTTPFQPKFEICGIKTETDSNIDFLKESNEEDFIPLSSSQSNNLFSNSKVINSSHLLKNRNIPGLDCSLPLGSHSQSPLYEIDTTGNRRTQFRSGSRSRSISPPRNRKHRRRDDTQTIFQIASQSERPLMLEQNVPNMSHEEFMEDKIRNQREKDDCIEAILLE